MATDLKQLLDYGMAALNSGDVLQQREVIDKIAALFSQKEQTDAINSVAQSYPTPGFEIRQMKDVPDFLIPFNLMIYCQMLWNKLYPNCSNIAVTAAYKLQAQPTNDQVLYQGPFNKMTLDDFLNTLQRSAELVHFITGTDTSKITSFLSAVKTTKTTVNNMFGNVDILANVGCIKDALIEMAKQHETNPEIKRSISGQSIMLDLMIQFLSGDTALIKK